MSAPEMQGRVNKIVEELRVTHTLATGVLRRVAESITDIQRLESNSPDAVIAIHGLEKIQGELIETTNELILTIRDTENIGHGI